MKHKNPLKAGFLSRSLICSGQSRHRCRKRLCRYRQLKRDNISGSRTFGTILNRELNLLAFVERFVIVALNGREMNKNIFAAVSWRNCHFQKATALNVRSGVHWLPTAITQG